MIDKDEYPDQAICTSTAVSSEACLLGGMVLKWHWRPNLVMGTNTQIWWDKFCAYFDVEPRLVPITPERLHLTGEEAAAHCDENTIAVVGILGSTFDGSYEHIAEIHRCLDGLQERTGLDIPMHVDAASGGFVTPFNSWGWFGIFTYPGCIRLMPVVISMEVSCQGLAG